MQVIPSINVPDFDKAKELIKIAKKFLPRTGGWLHLDVGDGVFSSIESWRDPVEFKSLKIGLWQTEVHLMAENPEDIAEAWLKTGVKRLIVHLESMVNSAFIMDLCQKYKADFMLAVNPETIVENLIPYFHNIEYFQILGVAPGKAGQQFQKSVLGKIEFLRARLAGAKIEVDGGVNLETAKLVKEAGADIIVSATYIFDSTDPKSAYRRLKEV